MVLLDVVDELMASCRKGLVTVVSSEAVGREYEAGLRWMDCAAVVIGMSITNVESIIGVHL